MEWDDDSIRLDDEASAELLDDLLHAQRVAINAPAEALIYIERALENLARHGLEP